MNVKKRIVLISAELKELNKLDNENRTDSMEQSLTNKNYKFVKVLGSYKGSLEHSFMVDASEDIVNPLLDLAKYFKQESILVVDEDQSAKLVYTKGQTEKLGTMTQIDNPKDLESWTFVNGQFYTVK